MFGLKPSTDAKVSRVSYGDRGKNWLGWLTFDLSDTKAYVGDKWRNAAKWNDDQHLHKFFAAAKNSL